MSLNGAISQIQRERDKPYLYMPNPTLIHPRTVKIDHYLKIVDVFIATGYPEVFVPEPKLGDYNPDAYFKDRNGNPLCVEVQLTPISTKKMQTKIDQFVGTYGTEHDSKTIFLVSNSSYDKVKVPSGFQLMKAAVPKEIYT